MNRYHLSVFNGDGKVHEFEVVAKSYYIYNSVYEFRNSNGSSTTYYTVVACFPVSMTAITQVVQL